METDEQIIQKLKTGNSASVDELYRRYARSLYVFFNSVTGRLSSGLMHGQSHGIGRSIQSILHSSD